MYREENLKPAIKQLEMKNMQMREEKYVLMQTLACDKEYQILENRIKIIEQQRKHYIEEINKWKDEAVELIRKNELIELLEESSQKYSF